jgi:hypothetical protein
VLSRRRNHRGPAGALAVCAVVVVGVLAATASGGTVPLRARVLRPNEFVTYGMVLSHGELRTVSVLSEELMSLCVKTEPSDELQRSGFTSGYRESLGSNAKASAGVAFSIVAQFSSQRRASSFVRHDDALCGRRAAKRRYGHDIAKLKLAQVPAAVGYRLSGGVKVNYSWAMFVVGQYVYVEAVVTNVPTEQRFTSAVRALYERVH